MTRVPTATPLVSVIVPCYVASAEQAELLDETLTTVDAQTYAEYEVIVVDDGSPIDVTPIVRSHQKTQTIRRQNGGSAAARNTGIQHSRGTFLVFLDADDHLLPVALETGLGMFDAHPECGFVVGPREEMTFEGLPVPWSVPVPPPETRLYTSLLGFEWYIIPPSAAMFRRDVVERAGGFQDPWGADDLDFYLRVARISRAWCYQHPAVTRYRRYSTSSSRDGERMLRSIRAVYARQWPLAQGDADAEPAFHRGLGMLTEIFLDCMVENVRDRLGNGDHDGARRTARVLGIESPRRLEALLAGLDPSTASLLRDVPME